MPKPKTVAKFVTYEAALNFCLATPSLGLLEVKTVPDGFAVTTSCLGNVTETGDHFSITLVDIPLTQAFLHGSATFRPPPNAKDR